MKEKITKTEKTSKKATAKDDLVKKTPVTKAEDVLKMPEDAGPQSTEEEMDSVLDKNLEKEIASKPDRYFEATGRRKTAVARVRLFTRGDKQFLVNGKNYTEYFPSFTDQQTVTASMRKMKCLDKFKVTVLVRGGGISAQAEAVRHGPARELVDFNNNFKKRLRKVGYLTRDPRMRERKKFGLKRARKSPQWAKR